LPEDPLIANAWGASGFRGHAVRRPTVVGHNQDGEWSIYAYAGDGDRRLVGYGTARTRRHALEHAGLSGEDAGEVLGRAGI
jgi:hypothetical protein